VVQKTYGSKKFKLKHHPIFGVSKYPINPLNPENPGSTGSA
jgi:hypothetical protein